MNSSNFDNHSKTSAFRKMFYTNIILGFQKSAKIVRIWINFLFFCMIACQTWNIFWALTSFLKNANISQLRRGKNPTTALYSETTKPEFFLWKVDYKKGKIRKQAHAFRNYAHTFYVEILNSLNPELQLKNYSRLRHWYCVWNNL